MCPKNLVSYARNFVLEKGDSKKKKGVELCRRQKKNVSTIILRRSMFVLFFSVREYIKNMYSIFYIYNIFFFVYSIIPALPSSHPPFPDK